jgi:hypothetical protein
MTALLPLGKATVALDINEYSGPIRPPIPIESGH